MEKSLVEKPSSVSELDDDDHDKQQNGISDMKCERRESSLDPAEVQKQSSDSSLWVTLRESTIPLPDTQQLVFSKNVSHDELKLKQRVDLAKPQLTLEGHELSVTDLLTPTLGQGQGVDRILDAYRLSDSGGLYSDGAKMQRIILVNGYAKINTDQYYNAEIPNSFAETRELGTTDFEKRWFVNVQLLKERDISFTLDDQKTLTVHRHDCNNHKKASEVPTALETITLWEGFDLDKVRIYLNRETGTLIIAYLR